MNTNLTIIADNNTPEEKIILQAFEANLAQINNLIHPNTRKRKSKAQITSEKPWYLLLGPNDAGKLTLVQQSKIDFTHTLTQDNNSHKAWITPSHVIINLPDYFIQNPIKPHLWKNLFNILKSFHGGNPCDGLLLVLDLPQLIRQPKVYGETLFNQIRSILKILSSRVKGTIPVQLVFTHLDQIRGFNDYFGDLSQEELENPLGLQLNITNKPEELLKHTKNELKNLYARLNQRLTWRLQHSHTQNERALIHNFTLQIQTVEPYILNLLQKIITSYIHKKCKLKGIFFTSSNQQGNILDTLHQPLELITNTLLEKKSMSPLTDQAYFSHKLLKSVIVADSKLNKIYWSRVINKKKMAA